MRVTVIVATYGAKEWREKGDRAYEAVPRGANDVIRVHRSDMTLAEARNFGAAAATPGWLCFLDADDRLHPDFITEMRLAATAYEIARNALLVPAMRGQGYSGIIPSWFGNLHHINCACIGTLIDRDLFNDLGGFRDTLADGTPLTSLEDWDLWLRAVKAGAVMVPIERAIYLVEGERGRNASQAPYEAIRAEHADFDWANIRRYKLAYPPMVES